jgi:hypothetical protein
LPAISQEQQEQLAANGTSFDGFIKHRIAAMNAAKIPVNVTVLNSSDALRTINICTSALAKVFGQSLCDLAMATIYEFCQAIPNQLSYCVMPAINSYIKDRNMVDGQTDKLAWQAVLHGKEVAANPYGISDNSTVATMTNTTHMSSNNASHASIIINQNPWTLLPQFIVSGLVAGAALFIANIALDKYRSPCLYIDKSDFLKLVEVDINLYDIDLPNFSRELRYFKVKYIVNRVIIKNNGKSAAEGCKGILKMKNAEEKICWYVPSEIYKMTINVDSIEYLDVCAVLNGDVKEVYQQLNILRNLVIQKMEEHKQKRPSKIFMSHEDIPIIIAPTENGWLSAKSNRSIEPGDATVIVNAKNARPYRLNIKILGKPAADNGRLIDLRD